VKALGSVYFKANTPSEKLGWIGNVLIFIQISLSGYIILILVWIIFIIPYSCFD
jgi:hypothetical protein